MRGTYLWVVRSRYITNRILHPVDVFSPVLGYSLEHKYTWQTLTRCVLVPAITGLVTTAEASLLASSTTTSGMPLRVQRLNFPRFNGHQNLAKVNNRTATLIPATLIPNDYLFIGNNCASTVVDG